MKETLPPEAITAEDIEKLPDKDEEPQEPPAKPGARKIAQPAMHENVMRSLSAKKVNHRRAKKSLVYNQKRKNRDKKKSKNEQPKIHSKKLSKSEYREKQALKLSAKKLNEKLQKMRDYGYAH